MALWIYYVVPMERVKQLPDLALGKRWPHRLLQAMPLSWKRSYLLRQSGGELGCESFDLTEHLRKSRRFLLAWPERGEDLLSAFPAMLAGIRAARNTVCFENFIMADDRTGREFTSALEEARARSARVRVHD